MLDIAGGLLIEGVCGDEGSCTFAVSDVGWSVAAGIVAALLAVWAVSCFKLGCHGRRSSEITIG